MLAATAGELEDKTEIPVWVFVVAGFMICVGLGRYGYSVMTTIGTNFAATLVLLIATIAGIPVSTTHTPAHVGRRSDGRRLGPWPGRS